MHGAWVRNPASRETAPEQLGAVFELSTRATLMFESAGEDDVVALGGEAALAHQVARLLPFHWTWPNRVAEEMSQIMDHVGDQRELIAWLDRHPGLPRLVARLYVFMGFLDRYSAVPAVVTAMREYRERTPYPPGLEPYLVPATDDDTLASIAFPGRGTAPSRSRNCSARSGLGRPSNWPSPLRHGCSRSRLARGNSLLTSAT
ncbi:hypothetical protein [Streptomyces misionensis]|uniref:hypothetical protein n=1 Tax=Streptomyces misionensis TaxID=67331 RepID=UPI0033B23946